MKATFFYGGLALKATLAVTLVGCGGPAPSGGGTTDEGTAGEESAWDGDKDVGKLQGLWEATQPWNGVKVVKEIEGTREVVTHLDKRGRALTRHAANFRVERVLDDRVRVFLWSDLEVIKGPGAGAGPTDLSGAYVFTCDGHILVEYRGSVGPVHPNDSHALVWRRR